MTVYVDDMRAKFGRLIMCHMIADSEIELHQMARIIGVARKWYQGDHYDICLSKRAIAVANGAREITQRECGAMVANRRCGLGLGKPETAIQILHERIASRRAGRSQHRDGWGM